MCGFFVQELILSVIYIKETLRLLKLQDTLQEEITSVTEEGILRHGHMKKTMYQLLAINAIIIAMDIALLSTEFANLYLIETTLKGVVYSIKLKLEFAVLSKLVQIVRTKNTNSSDLNHSSLALDAVHLPHLNTVVSCNLPLYHGVVMSSGGSPLDIHVLIDNGASENYVSPHLSTPVAGTHHHVCGREVETAGGNTSPITERVVFNLDLQGHSSSMFAFVFDTKFDIILGPSWLKEHRPKVNWLDDSWSVSCCLNVGASGVILPIHDRVGRDIEDIVAPTTLNYLISKNQVKKAVEKEGADACYLYLLDDTSLTTSSIINKSSFWSQLPKEFPSVFLNSLPGLPPERGVQHVIDTCDAKPLNRMPFRMSPAELNELNKQLNELLSLGLIRRSSSPWVRRCYS